MTTKPLPAEMAALLQSGPLAAHMPSVRGAIAAPTQEARAQIGERMANTQTATQVGDVAIIPIKGILTPRQTWISEWLGWTDMETLIADVEAAVASPSINTILFDVNSPGGRTEGIAGAAAKIRDAGKVKLVVAWGEGMMASAAYWLASGADEIVVEPAAWLGSIGTAAIIPAQEVPDMMGVMAHEFVSSVSPNKMPDPRTEAGAAEIQRNVDAFGALMVAEIMIGRPGLDDTRGGSIELGAAAVAFGLADRTEATIDDVLAELTGDNSTAMLVAPAAGALTTPTKGEAMNLSRLTTQQLAAQRPDLVATIAKDAAAAAALAQAANATAAAAPAARAPVTEDEHVAADKSTYAASAELQAEFRGESVYLAYQAGSRAGCIKIY